MNYSGIILVDTMAETYLDEAGNEVDDGDESDAVTIVHLVPVRVDWGTRKEPTHPKLRRATEALRFVVDRRFPEAFWAERHRETVLIMGQFRSPNWIEIASVIDINDSGRFAWE